jgi:alanyl-tRNA synthetase
MRRKRCGGDYNQTPFYAESGGQVGDTGTITGPDGLRITVTDTQKKLGDLFVHLGRVEAGEARVATPVVAAVDHARRTTIRAHHSATHLLHEALRQVLGDHVAQKGSLVAPDRLRFDFSHPKPMSPEEIERVEDLANDYVVQNSAVTTRLMALDDARASGARALFGEKYGDEVRVVAMGDGTGNTLGWSVELCGGTHVKRTGDIGLISVLSDSGVAAGGGGSKRSPENPRARRRTPWCRSQRPLRSSSKRRLKKCPRVWWHCSMSARSLSANSRKRKRSSPAGGGAAGRRGR